MEERELKRARAEPTRAVKLADSRDNVSSFLQSWAWKREHRPDRDRFQRPYVHSLALPGSEETGGGHVVKLTIEQARFRGVQGFASTVWDSSIVVAKMLERHPYLVAGRAILDLSAGCGLVAIVAAQLGARRTVATDLGPNLPLLRRNCERNGAGAVEVVEHWWGTDTAPLLLRGGGGGGGEHFKLSTAPPTSNASMAAKGDTAAQVKSREAPLNEVIGVEVEVAAPNTARKAVKTEAPKTDGGGGDGDGGGRGGVEVVGLRGSRGGDEGLDLVICCDVMYLEEEAGPLVTTLASLCGGKYDCGGGGGGDAPSGHQQRQGANLTAISAATAAGDSGGAAAAAATVSAATASTPKPDTTVILAHGRNRFAEKAFRRHAAAAGFKEEVLPWDELDPVYRCTDVDVYRLWLEGHVDVGRQGMGREDE